MDPAPVEGARHRLDLEQRQLRRAKDDEVELRVRRGVAAEKGRDPILRNRDRRRRRSSEDRVLGRDPRYVKERHRAKARQRSAEMLQCVRAGDRLDPLDDRDFPIGTARLADNAAQRAPLAEVARYRCDTEPPGSTPARIEMIAVTRRAAGQPRSQCRRPAFEIAPGAEHAVRIDHDPGIAISHVLAAHGRHDGLVIDAGVRHQHAEAAQCLDRPLLERSHLRGLSEPAIDREIEPPRVGDRRHPDPPLSLGRAGEALEKPHPGFAQGFGVGHDVGL